MIWMKSAIWREIVRVDDEIDKRVYQVYGVSPDEIKIIEGT
jgi:hypothetical protein